ncbi:TetR/AcrR family transcriptional regulator [Kitasatospora sp. NPDC002040]|uniref:TetR/AcrR family transcriptional regulator n=1 Tax=Kitasatospora sp. NPDC002040 TaxID=3154661 RepID=UPI003327CF84
MSDPGSPPTSAEVTALPGALRAPQQQRSREKVSRILAATARLLEERPYDEVGTKLIAAEAGVSVGVLYRFFPDKHAIVTALTVDWLDRIVQITVRALAGPLPADPRELIVRLLSEHTRFRTEQPGFHRLWYDGPPLPALREYDQASDRAIADLIRTVLVGEYGYADTPAFALRTRLAVHTAADLLNAAFRDRSDGDPAILAETELLLSRWLLALPDAD